jgi:DNA-binding beta-propeller fold protein YncE
MTYCLTRRHQRYIIDDGLSLATGAEGRTRRGFVAGGVAAVGTARLLGGPLLGAAADPAPKPCAPMPEGIRTGAIAVTPDGRTVWSADVRARTITSHSGRGLPRERVIDVGGAPLDVAISPDGALALVVTAFWDHPGLAIADLRSHEVERLDIGREPRAVAIAHDGRRAYVAGGGKSGILTPIDLRSRRVHAPLAVGSHPHDVALSPDGEHALVTLNGESAVAVVALARRQVVARIATSTFPHEIGLSGDGRWGLVTHSGLGARNVTTLEVHRHRTGRPVAVGFDPAGVAFPRLGSIGVVGSRESGRLGLVDARRGVRRRLLTIGGAPGAIAFAGTRAVVADAVSGELRALRLPVVA